MLTGPNGCLTNKGSKTNTKNDMHENQTSDHKVLLMLNTATLTLTPHQLKCSGFVKNYMLPRCALFPFMEMSDGGRAGLAEFMLVVVVKLYYLDYGINRYLSFWFEPSTCPNLNISDNCLC